MHILSVSASLLGFCFVILSFIHALDARERTLLDEVVALAVVIFLLTCILSYLSLQLKRHAEAYGRAADLTFFAGLILLSSAALLVVLRIVR